MPEAARIDLPGGVALSRLVYGMWRLTRDDTAAAHVQAKIEACLAQGITSFDQADVYGSHTSEGVLGAALKAAPHLRDSIEIVSKCGIMVPSDRFPDRRVKHYDTSPAHIRASVEASLKLMGLERLDLLLIHRPDPLMDHHATGAALDALVAEGKLRGVGVSNFRPHDLDLLQSALQTPLAVNQIEISLARPDAFLDGDIAGLQQRGIPPMAWSPLGGGRVVTDQGPLGQVLDRIARDQGVDRTAVAIAWLLHHPARILPVLGTNSLDRIARLSDALRVRIDRQDWFELLQAATGRDVP